MAESDKVFAGSIPKFYDTLMVPLIFEAYATGMAQLIAAASPGSVLESTAGSGVVARALAPQPLGRPAEPLRHARRPFVSKGCRAAAGASTVHPSKTPRRRRNSSRPTMNDPKQPAAPTT